MFKLDLLEENRESNFLVLHSCLKSLAIKILPPPLSHRSHLETVAMNHGPPSVHTRTRM